MGISPYTFILFASVYCAVGALVNISILMIIRRRSPQQRTKPLGNKIAWALFSAPLFPVYVYLYINECRDWHYDS